MKIRHVGRLLLSFTFISVASAPSISAQPVAKTKPNIIVFLVDDMGWQDTSVPFWNKATGIQPPVPHSQYGTPGA